MKQRAISARAISDLRKANFSRVRITRFYS
jgi:hypothetical protein